MSEQLNLREDLLKQLSHLSKNDMTKQYHVINKCIYEMIKNNELLTLDTVAEKCNLYYKVQASARYGKIVPQRVQRSIGGNSASAHHEEINCKLSSSGWSLKLGKSSCTAIFNDKNGYQHKLELNLSLTENSVP